MNKDTKTQEKKPAAILRHQEKFTTYPCQKIPSGAKAVPILVSVLSAGVQTGAVCGPMWTGSAGQGGDD